MFYGTQLLSKKDPLSLIYLAGILRGCKKISKKKVLTSNIEQLSKHIAEPQVQFALRVSGTLLLGIVVIYQKKIQYLLAEGNQLMSSVRIWDMNPRAANNEFSNVDLPPNKTTRSLESITLPVIDPLLLAVNGQLGNLLIPYGVGEVEDGTPDVGFSRHWRDLLSKGGMNITHNNSTFGESVDTEMTVTVSAERSYMANPRDITLDEVTDIPTFNGLMLDEDVFQTTAFEVSLDAVNGGVSFIIDNNNAHDWGGDGGQEVGFGADTSNHTAETNEEGTMQQKKKESKARRSKKRTIQELIIDDEATLPNEVLRANIEDSSRFVLDNPRPHFASSSVSSIPSLSWLLANPMTSGLAPEIVSLYQLQLCSADAASRNDPELKKHSRKRRRIDDSMEESRNGALNVDLFQSREHNDSVALDEWGGDGFGGGELGFGDDVLEPESMRSIQTTKTTPTSRQRLSIIDNNELASILLIDEATQTPLGKSPARITTPSSRATTTSPKSPDVLQLALTLDDSSNSPSRTKTASMEGKTWKMLHYFRTRMTNNDEQHKFEHLVNTKDPTLASLSFYHVLVLATNDFIKVKQNTPYGDINIQQSTHFDKDY